MSAGNVSIRQSSVAGFAPVHRCAHDVQFYSEDEFLLGSLTPLLAKAVRSGRAAVIVATQAHRERLAQRLEGDGVLVASAVEQGRYIALDAAETLGQFMVNGLPDRDRFMRVIGNVLQRAAAASQVKDAPINVFGEMVALLWQEGNARAAVELEDLWNELSQTQLFSLLCAYPLTGVDKEEHRELFDRICAQHHSVIPEESYSTLADEKDRLRRVARLQQAEQALKNESAERRMAEARTGKVQDLNQTLAEQIELRKRAEEELRRFTRRLLEARDEEQRKVARELHENTAQLLAALSLYLGVLQDEKENLNPRLAVVVESTPRRGPASAERDQQAFLLAASSDA
jgi:signal transduction histidine kinase